MAQGLENPEPDVDLKVDAARGARALHPAVEMCGNQKVMLLATLKTADTKKRAGLDEDA